MNQRTLTLGHSPDPDDAFMFYGLVTGKIDTGDLRFEQLLEDIETLNQRARRGELDVTALSVHAYAYVAELYALLPCGASIGDGYGPLVVSNRKIRRGDLRKLRIAIPGEMTTAFLTLRLCVGEFDFAAVPFDEIPDRVASGEFDAGLIIHEGQLTYAESGLHLLVDLGEWWKEETGLPLPLGVNGVRKELGDDLMRRVYELTRTSIDYGLAHREQALQYAMGWARGIDESLTDRFVGMYVNEYTLDCGESGHRAIRELLRRGYEAGVLPKLLEPEFVG